MHRIYSVSELHGAVLTLSERQSSRLLFSFILALKGPAEAFRPHFPCVEV
jgi:hypothetical protein